MGIPNDLSHSFVKMADKELINLEKQLSSFDPDEIEADFLGDVLSITVKKVEKIIINRNSAAKQIWVAATRLAWHFNYEAAEKKWLTATKKQELYFILNHTLTQLCGYQINLVPVKEY